MQKICLRVNMEDENMEDENSKRTMMKCIAGREGVNSVAVDMKERKVTVIGDFDILSLCYVLKKKGFGPELLSVGPAREETKVGWRWDDENRGRNSYLGMQRTEAVGGFGGMSRAIEDSVGRKAVAGFGGSMGSKTRMMKAVAGFRGITSIEVDLIKGMVTVVGKSVPVSVALKAREMGYRAKLLSLGPATEEEDTDEEHNDDLYPSYPSAPSAEAIRRGEIAWIWTAEARRRGIGWTWLPRNLPGRPKNLPEWPEG